MSITEKLAIIVLYQLAVFLCFKILNESRKFVKEYRIDKNDKKNKETGKQREVDIKKEE